MTTAALEPIVEQLQQLGIVAETVSSWSTEREQAKRIAQLEADLHAERVCNKKLLAQIKTLKEQLNNDDTITYCERTFKEVERPNGAQANDLVVFSGSDTPLISNGTPYRITKMYGKARFVLENNMVAGLYDSIVQRSVSDMRYYEEVR